MIEGADARKEELFRDVVRRDFTIINVDKLNAFGDGDTVDLQGVLSHGLASQTAPLLKVLGTGELSRKLVVKAQKFSASARAKIEAAGRVGKKRKTIKC